MDISEIGAEAERQRVASLTQTLADGVDFAALQAINTDDDGKAINENVAIFLDWARSLLRRIPNNWYEYLGQVPADLKSLFDEVEGLLTTIRSAGDGSETSRGAALSRLSSPIQTTMGRTVNSLRELLFLQMIGDDRSSEITSIMDRIALTERELQNVLIEASSKGEQLAEMAAASQEATAKIAASGRARIFHGEGKNFRNAARIWLSATTLLGFVLIVLAFSFAFNRILPMPQGANTAQIASYLFGKILVLATVGVAVTFAARQHSVNAHNAVQNFHRSSALRTYRALLAASRDEAIHEAMLHQAALAIFAPSDSGYTKGATGADSSPMFQMFQALPKATQQTPQA